MRVELARSGGLAGLTMAVSVDTDTLAPETAAVLQAALGDADLAELAVRPARPTRGADRYHYDITVERDGERHAISFPETDVPPELRPVIDALVPMTSPR